MNQNQIFDSDISTEKQCESITSNISLQMIISGVLLNWNTWKQIDDIVLSTAQLIRYNTLL